MITNKDMCTHKFKGLKKTTEKRGKWLPHPTDTDWNVCSVCGIGTHTRFHYNEGVYGGYDVEESFWYCPHCGARME